MSEELTNPILKDYPVKDISTPHAHDVLSGRGGGTNNHPGNTKFRELVQSRKVLYINCTKREKMSLSCAIVDSIRNQDPPGRFLQRNLRTGLWFDIGDQKAREKTSQALREGAPYIRRKISMGAAANALSIAASVANGIHEKDKQKFHESREYTMGMGSHLPHVSMHHSPDSSLQANNKMFLGPQRLNNPMIPLHHAERGIPPGFLLSRHGDPRRQTHDPAEVFSSPYALADMYRPGFLPRHPDHPAVAHHSLQQSLHAPHAGYPYGFLPPQAEHFRQPIPRSLLVNQGPASMNDAMIGRLQGNMAQNSIMNQNSGKNISTTDAARAVEPILDFLGKPSLKNSSQGSDESPNSTRPRSLSRENAMKSVQPVLDFMEKLYVKQGSILPKETTFGDRDVSEFFLQRLMFSEIFTKNSYRGNLDTTVLMREHEANLYEFAGLLGLSFDRLIYSDLSLEDTIENVLFRAESQVKNRHFSKLLIRTVNAGGASDKMHLYTDIMRGNVNFRKKGAHEQRITSAFHSINAF